MNGLVRCRKFVSRILVRLNERLSSSTPTIVALGYFLIGRFALILVWFALFVLEIPLHLLKHTTESFSVAALRGPQAEYQESYSSYLRRQKLAVVSVLGFFILLIGQLTYLGYSVIELAKPIRVGAQSGTIDINPSWDGAGILAELWQVGNPCTVEETTYEDGGDTSTALTYGQDISNPIDCDIIDSYYTRTHHVGMKFSLTAIPNNATITSVNLIVNVNNTTSQTGRLVLATSDSIDTLSRSDASFVSAISGGTQYTTVTWSTTGSKNVSLGAAVSQIQSRISGSDILPIGLYTDSTAGNNGAIDSVNHGTPANRPILRVGYTVPPTAPTDFGHSANTTTSITWSWTDLSATDTSNRVHDASHATVCTTAGDGGLVDGTVTCVEGSLSPNTQYTRHANVLDPEGNSDSTAASAYTSIETPTGISPVSLTPTSITVSATGSLANLGSGSSALWFEETVTNTNSGWITTNSWQKTGLTSNTTYHFRVKARNGDGDETAFTATSDVPTTAQAPDVSSARATSTWFTGGTFNFTNDIPFGAGGVEYYQYAWNIQGSFTFDGTQPTWCLSGCDVSNATLSQTATDGSAWRLHLDAYDTTDSASGGTLAIGPFYFDGTAPTAPTTVNDGTSTDISSQTSTTSLSANWTASTDVTSGLQKYQYAIGTTSGGTDVVAYTDNSTATTVTATGLTLNVGSTYYVSVRAVDVAGNSGAVTTSNGVTITAASSPAPSDTTGPILSSISTDSTSTTATIRWTTNEAATARVEYGLTATYSDEITRTTLATSHQLAITGLTPSTTYHFRITSVDASSNSTTTSDDTFATVAAPVASRGVTAPTLLRPVVRDGGNPSIIVTGVGKGNQTLTFFVNDRAVKTMLLDGALTETKSFAVKLLANIRPTGKYVVTVTATQSDGRVSEIHQQLTFRIKAETSGEKFIQPSVVSTYIVQAGDTLWKIAERMLGNGARWTEIAAANASRYPTLATIATIFAGWALTIPGP